MDAYFVLSLNIKQLSVLCPKRKVIYEKFVKVNYASYVEVHVIRLFESNKISLLSEIQVHQTLSCKKT